MTRDKNHITRLVAQWSEGDDRAFDELIELVYDDLKVLARHHLRANDRDGVVDTTVLVHEAYLKLLHLGQGDFEGRAQFFAFCSKAMRRILIDFARKRRARKRGGDPIRVPLRDDLLSVDQEAGEILRLDGILQRLEERHPRMSRIVECRFFGGMTVKETAEALKTSPRTVEREWTRARLYLKQALVTNG